MRWKTKIIGTTKLMLMINTKSTKRSSTMSTNGKKTNILALADIRLHDRPPCERGKIINKNPFCSAAKPEEQANSIVIEAQDASNNIKRRRKCPEGRVRVRCASDCQATCQNPDLVCPPEEGADCEEGCACAEGFVEFGEACVPIQSCPCYHEGFAFNHGHYIVQDCNTWYDFS